MAEPGNAIVRPVLHHVNLKTTRLSEMIEWYQLVLGMDVLFQWDGGVFMSNDDANHRVAMLTFPALADDPDKVSHNGMHHMSFEVPTVGDMLETYRRLRNVPIKPHMCLDHGNSLSMYYLDPDGNSVEIQADTFGDWERSSDFIRHSPQFAANPIGTFYDPDRVLAAFDAGAELAELHERSYAGEFVPPSRPDLRLPVPEEA